MIPAKPPKIVVSIAVQFIVIRGHVPRAVCSRLHIVSARQTDDVRLMWLQVVRVCLLCSVFAFVVDETQHDVRANLYDIRTCFSRFRFAYMSERAHVRAACQKLLFILWQKTAQKCTFFCF